MKSVMQEGGRVGGGISYYVCNATLVLLHILEYILWNEVELRYEGGGVGRR